MAATTAGKSKNSGINPWIGWGISTLLLLLFNRNDSTSSDTSAQQPSKFTDTNGNQIGNPIPVVLGRAMVKNPLVAYYGDFDYCIYTEEYGMHSSLDVWAFLFPLLLALIYAVSQPDTLIYAGGKGEEDNLDIKVQGGSTINEMPGLKVPSQLYAFTTTGPAPVQGSVSFSGTGQKRSQIVNVFAMLILWLLLQLFNNHEGRTTIQKGFKYYLGWQNILCWTGDNIGIKKLYMNVYDAEVEDSTQQGVWGNDNVAYKYGTDPILPDNWENITPTNGGGIFAYIEDPDMFGGADEQGGFIGEVRMYLGDEDQNKDPWMIKMMNNPNVPTNLQGLTPQYPMFFTCCVSSKLGTTQKRSRRPDAALLTVSTDIGSKGAYIGKQSTVPEMWFEIYNYPQRLGYYHKVTPDDWVDGNVYLLGNLVKRGGSVYRCIEKHQAALPFDSAKWKNIGAWNNTPIIPFKQIIGEDANPAEVIYEILINRYWGCKYNADDDTVDIDSLFYMAYVCEDEELGVSCLITELTRAGEYIDNILRHINAVRYDDPITGKLTFKMIRNDYLVEDLKVFNGSNCEDMDFSRLDWTETKSCVSLNFTLAEDMYNTAQLTVTDLANPKITGTYTEISVDGLYFTTPRNAKIMAQTHLLSAGYPLAAINFKTNRYGYNLTVGEPIVVSWKPYGIEKQVFRITDIDYATLTSGAISVTAIEDVFGFDKSNYTYAEIPTWTEPAKDPDAVEFKLWFEVPYEQTYMLDTFVRAYAIRPSDPTIYWSVWRWDDPKYEQKTESNVWSMGGRLTYGLEEAYEFEANKGFEFDVIGWETRSLLEDKVDKIAQFPYIYNKDSGLNLLVCDGEIMSYDSLTILPNGRFFVKGVVRGVYDTVPKTHTIESVVWLLENYQDINKGIAVAQSGMTSDESVEITTRGLYGAQNFDASATENFKTARRAECPSIMANLQFAADRDTETEYRYNFPAGTQFSHNIFFKFYGRNKFSNTNIRPHTDPSLSVASNLKNVIKIECADETCEWQFDGWDSTNNVTIESMEANWARFCDEMTNWNGSARAVEKIAQLNYCKFTIQTYDPDKDLYSYDKYEKEVLWVTPRLVGILEDVNDVKPYTDGIVRETTTVLPASSVNPQLTYNFEDCCLIFIGTLAANNPTYTGQTWLGQDGQRYILSDEAYRIDGSITTYDPSTGLPSYESIIHKVTLDNEYILRSNFNVVQGNYSDGIRYRNGQFIGYQFY